MQLEPSYLDWFGLGYLEIGALKILIWEMSFIALPVIRSPTVRRKKND